MSFLFRKKSSSKSSRSGRVTGAKSDSNPLSRQSSQEQTNADQLPIHTATSIDDAQRSANGSAATVGSSSSATIPARIQRPLCPCTQKAKEWLATPANTLNLQLMRENHDDEEWIISCPTLGTPADPVCFALTLVLPHGLAIVDEGSILEELEAESYDWLFGDEKPPAEDGHEGCTAAQILQFAHDFIRKLDSAWGDDGAAGSPGNKGKRASSDAFSEDDAGGDGGDDDGDAATLDDDDGFGDGGEDDGEWGDAAELDVLDSGVTAPSKKAPEPPAVCVFTREEITSQQAVMIPRVAAALSITPSAAVCLLRLARWNEDACITSYRKNPQEMVAKAHCNALLREYCQQPPEGQAEVECGVCYCEVPAADSFAMTCGHRFCTGCWQQYLKSELEGGSITGTNALQTKCMGSKCKETLGSECVELLLSTSDSPEQEEINKRLLERYENMLELSFVDESDTLQWCPAVGCTKILSNRSKLKTVKCTCGNMCCSECCSEAHAPCTCKESADWMLRDTGCNLDMKFILEQTKACPKCGVRTKKEGGCLFLTCAQCKAPWCWHCGQSGENHHVWECNRPTYEGTDTKSELNRYLFYFERYHNHRSSAQAATKALAACQTKMNKLVDTGMSFQLVEFLHQATALVLQCRRVLSWSYARAFFIQDPNAKRLFEYRQSELEQYTERLNQLTEGSESKLMADRLLVLDWTRALTKYLSGMEIDETDTSRAIPLGAKVTKIASPISPASANATADGTSIGTAAASSSSSATPTTQPNATPVVVAK